MNDNYLKLGSVFMQKTPNTMPLMVVGYLPVHPDTEEMYDYLVVLYPQGWISENSLLMIDHEEVGEVLFGGYFDEKTDEVMSKIQALE
ncbi:protein of unknown function [Lachnospiraceae bacterium XBB2008]|nr:protein of unknown function [Lachnospiraceae bacterium XBB2008]